MQEIHHKLQFLSDYNYIFLIVIFIVLIVVFYTLFRANKETLYRFGVLDKKHKDIVLAIEISEADLRDRIAQVSRGFAPVSEGLRKKVQEEIDNLNSVVHQSSTEMTETIKQLAETITQAGSHSKESGTDIKTLFEKQGIFLHDRFNELTAGEAQRTEDARRTLAATLTPQEKRIVNIEQLLTTRTEQQDTRIETLRDDITGQVAQLIQKERELQQEAHTQTTILMSDAINRLAGEVDAKLTMIIDKISHRFNEDLADTVQSFTSLQQQIEQLIAAKDEIGALGQDISSLTRLVLNKSGGGITRGYLPDMLSAMLPDDAYTLNPVINGHRAAAQLMMPGDQGAVIIDDSLVLQDFDIILSPDADEQAQAAARQRFGATVHAHISYVADCFISPPATGGSALLFIPSETAFAEIQANHKDSVHLAIERQIWLVSPTTLAAALNMARSALKDQKAREQLKHIRQALQSILHEAHSFEARLFEIGDHVNKAMRSVHRAESAGSKLLGEVRGAAGSAEQTGHHSEQPALTDGNQS